MSEPPSSPVSEPPSPHVGALAIVRFLSELAMLVALGFIGVWWGQELGGGVFGQVALSALLPVGAALLWGAFVGPRSSRRLRDPARLGLEVVLFGVAVGGLVWHGWWGYGVVLAVAYAASTSHGRAGG